MQFYVANTMSNYLAADIKYSKQNLCMAIFKLCSALSDTSYMKYLESMERTVELERIS